MKMDFVMVVEGILLRGRSTKLGYLTMIIICLVMGIFSYIWQSRKIALYKEKILHMTKRIDVTIMQKEIIEIKWHHCCYIYTFSGLDEYKGINFYDKLALVEKSHVVGERVSLLINEWNVEEFWFEEEVELGKEIIVCSLILIFVTIIEVIIALDNWDSVPWF